MVQHQKNLSVLPYLFTRLKGKYSVNISADVIDEDKTLQHSHDFLKNIRKLVIELSKWEKKL